MAITSDAIGLIFRASGDTDDAKKAYSDLRTSITRDINNIEQSGSKGFAGLSKSINISGESIASLGQSISQLGRTLTVSLTLPLAALAGLSSKSALEFDAIRTKMIALVGDADKAAQKIEELRGVSANSVGLTQTAALEIYTQLKGIGGVTDETINQMAKSLGKLNAAFKIDDLAGFNQNLNQIFSQGFERADIKEAIGRVPFFEQLLEQAFGTKDPEKLKALQASGALTLDTFLLGISGAIQNDERIKNIQDNLTVKLAKSWERVSMALVPLGETILNLVLPAIDKLIPYIESLAKWFQNAGPAIQTAVVAFGAFLAALGPALLVIGGVVAAIGSIVTSVAAMGGVAATLGAIGIAVLAVTGFLIQMGPVIAIVSAQIYLLYQAWQTNFGGLRDFTIQAWNAIRNAFQTAMAAIGEITTRLGGALVAWWERNWPLIEQTVERVSNAIKATVQGLLTAIQSFWDSHGEKIIGYATYIWEQISTIVETVLTQIGNVIRLGMQVINGDWQGAWDTVLDIVRTAASSFSEMIVRMVSYARENFGNLILTVISEGVRFAAELERMATKAVAGFIGIMATLPFRLVELIPEFIKAGASIGDAIIEGIRRGFNAKAAVGGGIIPLLSGQVGDYVGNSNFQYAGGGTPDPVSRASSTGGDGDSKADAAAKKRAREREAAASADLQARLTLEKNNLKEAEDSYKEALGRIREEFKKTGESAPFLTNAQNALSDYVNAIGEITPLLEKLEDEQRGVFDGTATAGQADLLVQEQAQRRADQQREVNKYVDENNKLLTESTKKEADKRVKITDEEAKRKLALESASTRTAMAERAQSLQLGLISESAYAKAVGELKLKLLEYERSLTNDLHEQKILDEEIKQQKIENGQAVVTAIEKEIAAREKNLQKQKEEAEEARKKAEAELLKQNQADLDGAGGGVLSGIVNGMGASIEGMLKKVEPLKGIGNIIGAQFNAIAQGVGNAVKAFVLFGTAGGSIKKFAAEIIASVAQMAIVQAVWELAQGFAMLALSWFTANPKYAASATAHFTAAAIYGVVGGIAAIAGRAIAGDSFRQETAGGFGSSGQSQSSSSNRNTAGQGRQFSGFGDDATIIDTSRNAPSTEVGVGVELRIKDKSNWFADMFEVELKSNGKLRRLVLDAAAN